MNMSIILVLIIEPYQNHVSSDSAKGVLGDARFWQLVTLQQNQVVPKKYWKKQVILLKKKAALPFSFVIFSIRKVTDD